MLSLLELVFGVLGFACLSSESNTVSKIPRSVPRSQVRLAADDLDQSTSTVLSEHTINPVRPSIQTEGGHYPTPPPEKSLVQSVCSIFAVL